MLNLTLQEFENLNLYSNRNMDKILGSIINESSNAVLVATYDDSVVLLDHVEGQFYVADYEFNKDTLILKMENFEPIELKKEVDDFRDSVFDFFEDEEASAQQLSESYVENVLNQEKFINELINESMSTKNFENFIDYNAIKEALGEVEVESKNAKFFEEYRNRLETHPLSEVKLFDWESPVIVSLIETEEVKLVNRTAIQKAHDLWKQEEFKKSFGEACEVFIEDVEEGTEKLKDLMEEYPQIFFLDSADRKSVFGKAIISNNKLREDSEDLLKGLDLMFEKFDLSEMRKEFLSEAGEVEDKEDKKEPEDMPSEVEAPDLEKIAKDLEKVAEKIEDEATKKKLDDIISSLKKGESEGTRPETVKEAVAILSL